MQQYPPTKSLVRGVTSAAAPAGARPAIPPTENQGGGGSGSGGLTRPNQSISATAVVARP